ncbi:hypothetical protein CCACVL1_26224 [Corchorus capsularis]|uniref:Uncharacterized protein n=1 Tax=Corchorus capsularis TaxID=210143 RepID=A0A1R3GFK3_COCAP|nr:hypothetical protein CCACVL1_26224 [Corchorus capsularis]
MEKNSLKSPKNVFPASMVDLEHPLALLKTKDSGHPGAHQELHQN